MQPLKLSNVEKDRMIEEIKIYFKNEREEEIGDLAAMLVMAFIIEKIGPIFYNLGIRDAIHYLTERVEDLHALER